MMDEPSGRALWVAVGSAAAIALLAGGAVAIEAATSLREALACGEAIAVWAYHFLRFFTILTNIYVALLMATTTWRLVRGRALPAANYYAAATVYVVLMGVTYELLLRHLWSPQGLQFATDLTMHDIVPSLTLAFWLFLAPKLPLRWRNAVRWLEYPLVYFVGTLAAGALGAGYPYDFLDAGQLGYDGVALNAIVFLAAFLVLGFAVIGLARLMRGRSAPRAGTSDRLGERRSLS